MGIMRFLDLRFSFRRVKRLSTSVWTEGAGWWGEVIEVSVDVEVVLALKRGRKREIGFKIKGAVLNPPSPFDTPTTHRLVVP